MVATQRRTTPRQLLVALDAAEWTLVERWAGEGKLPTFARLIEEGTRAVLSSTAAQLPDTVWPVLYTGVNPGKLERYFYVQYDASTLGLRLLTDDAIHRPPFWEYLSRAGVRVGIADAPKFRHSPKTLKGFQLSNWGAHATKTASTSQPPSLYDEIISRFGKHPVGDCDCLVDKPEAYLDLRRRVLDGIRMRGQVLRWLIREQQWDVFMAGFSEPHCIGHHFWHWLDPAAPGYGAKDVHGLADTVEQVYRAIDREIGELLAAVGPDTRCLVFAAHGMGAMNHASWNLPEILELLGYGHGPARHAVSHNETNKTEREARVNPWRVLKMVVPGPLQYRIKAMLPVPLQHQLLFQWYRGGQRWDGCRAFQVPNNDSVGAIRISVRGRDRGGLVEPEEYHSVCRAISDALRELVDPATGRPVVLQVSQASELFSGPFLDGLPDLMVLWDQSFRWSALHSPRFGTLQLRSQDSRSGSHTTYGFVLAQGPGVPAGEEFTGHSIYDIVPTVLSTAGVPVPDDLDGQPLPLTAAEVPR